MSAVGHRQKALDWIMQCVAHMLPRMALNVIKNHINNLQQWLQCVEWGRGEPCRVVVYVRATRGPQSGSTSCQQAPHFSGGTLDGWAWRHWLCCCCGCHCGNFQIDFCTCCPPKRNAAKQCTHTRSLEKTHHRLLFYVRACVCEFGCLWAGITVNHERPRRKRVAQNDDKETKKNSRQRCNGGGNT